MQENTSQATDCLPGRIRPGKASSAVNKHVQRSYRSAVPEVALFLLIPSVAFAFSWHAFAFATTFSATQSAGVESGTPNLDSTQGANAAANKSPHSPASGLAVVQCPSAEYVDLGSCINAAKNASEIRVFDGSYSTTTIITPAQGQVIEWGVGIYTLGGIDCPDSMTETVLGCDLVGSGSDRTVLRLANGANRDLITDANYPKLSASPPCMPPWTGPGCWGSFRMSIREMTLDGNKSHNARGNVLRWYGRAALIENVTAENATQDCIDSTWLGDSPFTDPDFTLETRILNTQEEFCGDNGMTLRGPHDIYIAHNYSSRVGRYSYEIETPVTMSDANAYLSGIGACYVHGSSGPGSNAALSGTNLVCSSLGYALYVDSTAQPVLLNNAILAADNHGSAVTLLVPTNEINGKIIQQNPAGTALQVGDIGHQATVILSGILQSAGNWFDFKNEGGGASNIQVTSDNTRGKELFVSHEPGPRDTIILPFTPSSSRYSGKPYVQIPGMLLPHNGPSM